MKVLVFAHRLEIGGTQTNAIELASSVRDRSDHDVVLFAAPGPAEQLAAEHQLRVVHAPDAQHHPSLARVRALSEVVKQVRPDVIHAWDWPQCFDAYYLEHMVRGVPVLCTVMGMVVPSFLPRALPTTFGTPQLQSMAAKTRRGRVDLLEPPVDMTYNAPNTVDPEPFKQEFGLDDDRVTLVIVSRLVSWLKLESLLSAVEATRALVAAGHDLRLVIVGEGPARDQLERLAADVNMATKPGTIVLTGGLIDPRPAYAAADVMLGMGGSALRALAFAKPLIVLGEEGFSEIFTPETSSTFLWQGYYGVGDPTGNPLRLQNQIAELVSSPQRCRELAAYGRGVVEHRYSLPLAADRLADLYRDVAGSRTAATTRVFEGGRTAGYLAARGLRARAGALKRS